MKEYIKNYKSESKYMSKDLIKMEKEQRKEEKELMKESWKDYCKKITLSTGFKILDNLDIIQTNSIATIYGHPASGKSSFAFNITVNLLKQGKSCIIFTLDSNKQEIECFLACTIANVDINNIKTNKATNMEKEKYVEAIKWLNTIQLEIYEGHFTAYDIYNIVSKEPNKMCFRENRPNLVLVDSVAFILPTRLTNSIRVLSCIKHRNTAVILTECSTRNNPSKLKDRELIKISDKIIRLKKSVAYVTEKELNILETQGKLNDIELKIMKNKDGKKGKTILNKNLMIFTEKENENNGIKN